MVKILANLAWGSCYADLTATDTHKAGIYLSHQFEKKLVAKREFNNTMDKQAVKVVKGDETVGHLPCKFSQIV